MKKKLDRKFVWKIIFATSAILVLSYNAFSYDLFNYVFDAKIYTYYHLNPYLHKALDFPGDPMLSFMRWTHRVYPYGPVWLLLTIPLSYLGMNLFLPTVFLFKFLIAGSFLGSLYFISKIFRKISPTREVLGLVAFGLNPLVLVETLVSGHLDMVMILFSLWATYMLIQKKYKFAFLLILLSVGVKFSSMFLLPLFIWFFVCDKLSQWGAKRRGNLLWISSLFSIASNDGGINWELFFNIGTVLMLLTVYISSVYSGNFQQWYLLLPLSFAVFIHDKYYISIPAFVLSFIALMTYAPYLYLGNGDDSVTQIMYQLLIIGSILSIFLVVIYKTRHNRFAS